MRRIASRALTASVIACGVMVMPATAGAAPTKAPNAELINLTCDNGVSGQVVVSGNGEWTPAHLLGSTTVIIPFSFGESTFTAYDAAGAVLFSGTEPPVTGHARGRTNHATPVECTYDSGRIAVPGGDPELPPGTAFIQFSGTVSAFVVASH